LIGTGKSSRWKLLVDPNGREYRPEEVDGDCMAEMADDGVGLNAEARRAFNRWCKWDDGFVMIGGEL